MVLKIISIFLTLLQTSVQTFEWFERLISCGFQIERVELRRMSCGECHTYCNSNIDKAHTFLLDGLFDQHLLIFTWRKKENCPNILRCILPPPASLIATSLSCKLTSIAAYRIAKLRQAVRRTSIPYLSAFLIFLVFTLVLLRCYTPTLFNSSTRSHRRTKLPTNSITLECSRLFSIQT